MSLGLFNPNLMFGALIWFMIGLVATIVAKEYFVKDYPRIKKEESNTLAMVVVWTGTICMWLFWSFVYMHQLIPLINPSKPSM
mmetsp:Transcript_65886/g.157512  ORF Transcript_65886/g.157512 Transcript_65886/m.157512 type:complete len:83 (+) Transcript_65886:120-368(+)